MATQTLAMAKLLINDEIVSGIAQDIIDINPIFSVLPFTSYDGQAIIVNRELALGDATTYAIGATITSKAAATFTRRTFSAVKIIGDAEMDLLVQATSQSAGVDQIAVEISSKAKNVGRLFQLGMFQGTGTPPALNSLHSLMSGLTGQFATASATARDLSFALMDELLDLVKSKDGIVDWIVMPAKTFRAYKVLLRALGGVPADWVVNLPDGRYTIGYEGIPVFKSEFLKINETANGAALTGGTMNSIYAGVWDDGSQKVGIAGIHPSSIPAGIATEYIGKSKDKDEETWRIKWYTNLAMFNQKCLARIASLK